MSGIHCGRHLPYGLLDVSGGFEVDMHATLRERAEHAIRATWPEMDALERAAWLRDLAEKIEAKAARDAAQDLKDRGGA